MASSCAGGFLTPCASLAPAVEWVATGVIDLVGGRGSVAPFETDGDSILDGLDQCEAFGVTLTGCPPPPSMGHDEDAVPNVLDICPATPGLEVDVQGCSAPHGKDLRLQRHALERVRRWAVSVIACHHARRRPPVDHGQGTSSQRPTL